MTQAALTTPLSAESIQQAYEAAGGQQVTTLSPEQYFTLRMTGALASTDHNTRFRGLALNPRQDFFLRVLEDSGDMSAFDRGLRLIEKTNQIVREQIGQPQKIAERFQDRFITEALHIWLGLRKDLTPPPQDPETMVYYSLFKNAIHDEVEGLKKRTARHETPPRVPAGTPIRDALARAAKNTLRTVAVTGMCLATFQDPKDFGSHVPNELEDLPQKIELWKHRLPFAVDAFLDEIEPNAIVLTSQPQTTLPLRGPIDVPAVEPGP